MGAGIKAQLTTIQSLKNFGVVGLAQTEISRANGTTTELVQHIGVEGMQRLALLQHHQVGEVYHRIDAVHTRPLKALTQPGGRRLCSVDAGDFCHGIKPSGLHGGGTLSIGLQCSKSGWRMEGWQLKRRTGEGRHLAGDPGHRQTIGTVGRDRQLQDGVVESQQRSCRGAGGALGVVAELDLGVLVVGELVDDVGSLPSSNRPHPLVTRTSPASAAAPPCARHLPIVHDVGRPWWTRADSTDRLGSMVSLTAVRGDITTQQVDAIVNAANTAMRGGGGVDGAIHRAGGPAVLEDCIARFPNGLATGDAGWTTSGDLPSRWVIHTVGPNHRAGQTDRSLLVSCYRRSLEVAHELGVQTIAFPLISAGVYGWPKEDAIAAAVETIRATPTEVEEARLVAFDEATHAAIEHWLA